MQPIIKEETSSPNANITSIEVEQNNKRKIKLNQHECVNEDGVKKQKFNEITQTEKHEKENEPQDVLLNQEPKIESMEANDGTLQKKKTQTKDTAVMTIENSGTQQEPESQTSDDGDEIVMTEQQKEAFDYVEKLVTDPEFRSKNSTAVIITGPASTGKTRLLQHLDEFVRTRLNLETICVSTMGVSALAFEFGKTSHSMFGYPRKLKEDDQIEDVICKLNDQDDFQVALIDKVNSASLIIYDNINMEDSRKIEMLDRFLRKHMVENMPFGGKPIIFSGDFLQVPPLVQGNVHPPRYSLKLSPLFRNFKKFSLDNESQVWNIEKYFSEILDMVRVRDNTGIFSRADIDFVENVSDLIDFVFPMEDFKDTDTCSKRVILHPTIKGSFDINEDIMRLRVIQRNVEVKSFPRENFEFPYDDESDDEDDEENILPPELLELWNGSLCMLVKTIDHDRRLLVGARVIIDNIENDEITIRKPGTDNKTIIQREVFKYNKEYFKQFPLRLAYATTIHKAQGQIFDKVGVDLRKDVFRDGQLYQALSRVLNREDIIVCPEKIDTDRGTFRVKNKVEFRMI